jgi:hypothetical protein
VAAFSSNSWYDEASERCIGMILEHIGCIRPLHMILHDNSIILISSWHSRSPSVEHDVLGGKKGIWTIKIK